MAAFVECHQATAYRSNAEEKSVNGSDSTQAAAYQDARGRLQVSKDATRERTKDLTGIRYCTLFYKG